MRKNLSTVLHSVFWLSSSQAIELRLMAGLGIQGTKINKIDPDN